MAISLPAQGINLSNSRSYLELKNFSHLPQKTAVDIDISGLAISEGDHSFVETRIDFDTIFYTDQSQAFVKSRSETNVSGSGSNYFGQGRTISQAIGDFSVAANQNFFFEIETFLNITTIFNTSKTATYRTGSYLNLSLMDRSSNNIIDEWEILGLQENNSASNIPFRYQEAGGSQFIPDREEIGSFNQIFNNYLISTQYTSWNGYFLSSFSQDTELRLIATTQNQSCVNKLQATNRCDQFPERSSSKAVPFQPSSQLLIFLIGTFITIRLIKKQMIKFGI